MFGCITGCVEFSGSLERGGAGEIGSRGDGFFSVLKGVEPSGRLMARGQISTGKIFFPPAPPHHRTTAFLFPQLEQKAVL